MPPSWWCYFFYFTLIWGGGLLASKADASCLVVSGLDYDYNDALEWSSPYLGNKKNVTWRRQHLMTLPRGTSIMAWQTATYQAAGQRCTIFASWGDLIKFLNDPPDEFQEELTHQSLLIYQGTHGVPGGEAHCNDGEYILGRDILAAIRTIHNMEKFQHHHLAVLVDSCYSGDLLRKMLLAQALEKEDLKRLCLVTSSSFGQTSYQGEAFYRLVKDVDAGENVSLMGRFKQWSPGKHGMISGGYFDYLGLTPAVLERYEYEPTAQFLDKLAQTLEQAVQAKAQAAPSHFLPLTDPTLRDVQAFYAMAACQEKLDVFDVEQGAYLSWEDRGSFYERQLKTRFYIEDLIKRIQEVQKAWRVWKKGIHELAQEWMLKAIQEFTAELISGLRDDQQRRGEWINYYRLQDLWQELYDESLPFRWMPPHAGDHGGQTPAKIWEALVFDLPLAPCSTALDDYWRWQTMIGRWDQQTPLEVRRWWHHQKTPVAQAQLAQIILQGRLHNQKAAEYAAQTLAHASRFLLQGGLAAESAAQLSAGDYQRYQACQNFNFADL